MAPGSQLWDRCCEAGLYLVQPCFGGRAPSVVDPVPGSVSELTTPEEVWRMLKATQPDWEGRYPWVQDMVRKVERMTGVVAVDVTAAELLDIARYVTRSPPPPNLVHIGQLVFGVQSLPLSEDGSFSWGRVFTPRVLTRDHTWRILVVCVLVTPDVAARRTATPWV